MTKQRKNPEHDRYVAVTLTPEDLAWAKRQDRYACAIVRSIQRTLPDATRVMVDKEHIAFTLDRDDMRYTFITPEEVIENVIKPFDKGQEVVPNFTFQLVNPIAANPRQHMDAKERQAHRVTTRHTPQRRVTSSKNTAVKTTNRFLDAEAE